MLLNSGVSLFSLCLQRPNIEHHAVLGFSAVPFHTLLATKETFLHESELIAYESLTHERRQQSFLQGRCLAKQVISAFTGLENPRQILVQNGVFGQPLVRGTKTPAPAISLAHTDTYTVCVAFPEEHPMGIDIELVRDTAKESICSQTTRHEKRLAMAATEDENRFYTRLWTVKEALSKVLKTGLLTPFAVYEVAAMQLLGNAVTRSTFTNFGQYQALSFLWRNAICSVALPEQTICRFPESLILYLSEGGYTINKPVSHSPAYR